MIYYAQVPYWLKSARAERFLVGPMSLLLLLQLALILCALGHGNLNLPLPLNNAGRVPLTPAVNPFYGFTCKT